MVERKFIQDEEIEENVGHWIPSTSTNRRRIYNRNVGIMMHVLSLMETHIKVNSEILKWCMMEAHIVIGLLRGNRVMPQKNKMMGQRISDQNQEIEER